MKECLKKINVGHEYEQGWKDVGTGRLSAGSPISFISFVCEIIAPFPGSLHSQIGGNVMGEKFQAAQNEMVLFTCK